MRHAITSRVMKLPIFSSADRPSASTRRTRSRSVTAPIGSPLSLQIGTKPKFSCFMSFAQSWTEMPSSQHFALLITSSTRMGSLLF